MKNISRSIIEAYDLLKADLVFLSSIELTKKSPDPKKESLFTNVKEILNKIELENDIDDDIIKDGYELIAASFKNIRTKENFSKPNKIGEDIFSIHYLMK